MVEQCELIMIICDSDLFLGGMSRACQPRGANAPACETHRQHLLQKRNSNNVDRSVQGYVDRVPGFSLMDLRTPYSFMNSSGLVILTAPEQ